MCYFGKCLFKDCVRFLCDVKKMSASLGLTLIGPVCTVPASASLDTQSSVVTPMIRNIKLL